MRLSENFSLLENETTRKSLIVHRYANQVYLHIFKNSFRTFHLYLISCFLASCNEGVSESASTRKCRCCLTQDRNSCEITQQRVTMLSLESFHLIRSMYIFYAITVKFFITVTFIIYLHLVFQCTLFSIVTIKFAPESRTLTTPQMNHCGFLWGPVNLSGAYQR